MYQSGSIMVIVIYGQWACKSALKNFTEDALTISADSSFQNGTARFLFVGTWTRSPLRVGCAKVNATLNYNVLLVLPLPYFARS